MESENNFSDFFITRFNQIIKQRMPVSTKKSKRFGFFRITYLKKQFFLH